MHKRMGYILGVRGGKHATASPAESGGLQTLLYQRFLTQAQRAPPQPPPLTTCDVTQCIACAPSYAPRSIDARVGAQTARPGAGGTQAFGNAPTARYQEFVDLALGKSQRCAAVSQHAVELI